MLPGLPIPTLPARIERVWSEGDEVWLRLAPPPFPYPDTDRPDLRLVHVEDDHLVLEQETVSGALQKWWARLEPPATLHAGTEPAPAVIEQPVTPDRAGEVLQADVPAKLSAEWLSHCVRERRLTPGLTIAGDPIPEETPIAAHLSSGDVILSGRGEERFEPVDAVHDERGTVIFLSASYRTIILEERPPVVPVHVTFTTPLYYPSLQPDDLYAYAVTLYEMVVGQHPFRTLPVHPYPHRKHVTDIPLPGELRPDLPPALSDLIMRGLRVQPHQPPIASFAEFADALEAWAEYPTAASR